MKALPSIAFNEFKGSAGDVTARVSKGRQVLSTRCQHSHVKTGPQAVSRNRLSSISRSFRKLSDSQMKGWAVLAERMKGISTFGKAAELTAHNAFVRINTNRSLAGMPALESAPVYTSDVPEVDYDDFWVTPDRIIFVGLNQPSGHHRLVVKMSQTTSTGVSSGWNNIVIITPAFYSDWGDADITEAYIDRIGFAPVPGQKYFLSFWWMDTETGFTGESMAVSTICGEFSNVNKELYKVRPRMNFSDAVSDANSPFKDMRLELSGSPVLVTASGEYGFLGNGSYMYIDFNDEDFPREDVDCFLMGRGLGKCKYEIACIEHSVRPLVGRDGYGRRIAISRRGGQYLKEFEVFGTAAEVTENVIRG